MKESVLSLPATTTTSGLSRTGPRSSDRSSVVPVQYRIAYRSTVWKSDLYRAGPVHTGFPSSQCDSLTWLRKWETLRSNMITEMRNATVQHDYGSEKCDSPGPCPTPSSWGCHVSTSEPGFFFSSFLFFFPLFFLAVTGFFLFSFFLGLPAVLLQTSAPPSPPTLVMVCQ